MTVTIRVSECSIKSVLFITELCELQILLLEPYSWFQCLVSEYLIPGSRVIGSSHCYAV